MTPPTTPPDAADTCQCELRDRQWNGAGTCLTCRRHYPHTKSGFPVSTKEIPPDAADEFAIDRSVIEAATPGDWRYDDGVTDDRCEPPSRGKLAMIETVLLRDPPASPNYEHVLIADMEIDRDIDRRDKNAVFIARARSRWPLALDTISRLSAELAALKVERNAADLILRMIAAEKIAFYYSDLRGRTEFVFCGEQPYPTWRLLSGDWSALIDAMGGWEKCRAAVERAR